MNPRSLLIAVTLWAMPLVVVTQGLIASQAHGSDPYAMTPTSHNPFWWGNGFAFPTGSCLRDRFWVSLDYLHWWPEGMDLPPLVTSAAAGSSIADAGTLGAAGTTVLFGDGEVNDDAINGLRLRSGMFFFFGKWAIESEFFRFSNSSEGFTASSNGSPILARPFFDIANNDQSSRLIGYPNLSSGTVAIQSESRLQSGLINLRASLIPLSQLGCESGCDPPDRIDWILGYRVVELKDGVAISDTRNLVGPANPDSISSNDSFETRNRFHGLQLGVVYKGHFRRLWMESMIRIALGNNEQSASIRGGTSITDAGITNNFNGGLLAQRSNIGDYEQDAFLLLPELGLNFGIRVTRCLHAVVGYNVIYFPTVWRAGDQIDLDVNSGLIPPETITFSGALRPRFQAVEDDYLAHGLNFGAELRF